MFTQNFSHPLEIKPDYFTHEDYTICDGDSLFWQGNYYNSSGQFTINNFSVNGCDSIFKMTLTVNDTFYFIDNYSICDGDSILWHGNYYQIAGDYSESYYSINSCDSIYELNLEVNPNPIVGNIFGEDTVDLNQFELYYLLDNTIIYYWDVINGTLISQISNNVVQVQWDSLGIGYIYIFMRKINMDAKVIQLYWMLL